MSLEPKILADENIPRSTVQSLRDAGYDAVSVWEVGPGMSDDEVVRLSVRDQRIINNIQQGLWTASSHKTRYTGRYNAESPTSQPRIHHTPNPLGS